MYYSPSHGNDFRRQGVPDNRQFNRDDFKRAEHDDWRRRDRDDFRRRWWWYGAYGWGYDPWYWWLYQDRWQYPSSYLSYAAPPVDYSSYYSGPVEPAEAEPDDQATATDPNIVLLGVRVPADARVWIEGRLMNQSGPIRLFESPALEPDSDYHYEIQARWTEGGKQVTRSRQVTVRAGDRIIVNFAEPGAPAARAR
jgi:uncharacterized protein (TIGR03000 family)